MGTIKHECDEIKRHGFLDRQVHYVSSAWWLKSGRTTLSLITHCPYCGEKLEKPKLPPLEKDLEGRTIQRVMGDFDKLTVWFTDGSKLVILAKRTIIQSRAMMSLELTQDIIEPSGEMIEVSREAIESWALRASRMNWSQLGADIRKVLDD